MVTEFCLTDLQKLITEDTKVSEGSKRNSDAFDGDEDVAQSVDTEESMVYREDGKLANANLYLRIAR